MFVTRGLKVTSILRKWIRHGRPESASGKEATKKKTQHHRLIGEGNLLYVKLIALWTSGFGRTGANVWGRTMWRDVACDFDLKRAKPGRVNRNGWKVCAENLDFKFGSTMLSDLDSEIKKKPTQEKSSNSAACKWPGCKIYCAIFYKILRIQKYVAHMYEKLT